MIHYGFDIPETSSNKVQEVLAKFYSMFVEFSIVGSVYIPDQYFSH